VFERRIVDNETPQENKSIIPETRITVDFRPGRWSKVYHLFDLDGREITLPQKEAVRLAKNILKIAGEKEQKP